MFKKIIIFIFIIIAILVTAEINLELLPFTIKENIERNYDEFTKFYYTIYPDESFFYIADKKILFPEDFEPFDLVVLTNKDFSSIDKSFRIRNSVIPSLKELFLAAEKDRVKLTVVSAYRSYKEQIELLREYTKLLGEERAKKQVALPGSSEHQLGTALDLKITITGNDFSKANWLINNAYKYGFVMSYPQGNKAGYIYEPWHYRFIGKEASFIVNRYFNNSAEDFLEWYGRKYYSTKQ